MILNNLWPAVIGGGAIIGAASLIGHDMEIATPSALAISFSPWETVESITTNVAKRVWCRIDKRGAAWSTSSADTPAVMVQGRWKNAGTVARYTKAISADVALQWL